MSHELENARARMEALRGEISGSAPLNTAPFWGGADVIVTDTLREPREAVFYHEPRYVVTPFAPQLSWLLVELWAVFKPLMNGSSKIEFFGRLANAANRQIARSSDLRDPEELLAAVLHEGFAIADELDEGSFRYLDVSFGNMIYDDLIDEAERQGYLTVEETAEWFSDRDLS